MAMKYKWLAGQLRRELLEHGGQKGYKLPTEQELVRHYQVSRQTVRHALQVLEEEGLILRRQGSGAYTTGKPLSAPPRQIAVITSFLDDYIFPAILHDAQSLFSQYQYATVVYATENQTMAERDILLKLLNQPVSGLLVEGTKTALPTPNVDLYQRLRQTGLPMVFLHGVYANLSGIPCIADNNYDGGYQLGRYLVQQGHQKIAGIFKSDDIQGPQRYYGAVSAMRDGGLDISDGRFAWYDTEDRRRLMEGKDDRLLKHFLQERLGDATAVVCYNDEVAYPLIQALLSAGKRIPKDVAVVSFDNSYYSQMGAVPITSLRHHSSRMGRVAAEQLIMLLEGGTAQSKYLDWELVERASSQIDRT